MKYLKSFLLVIITILITSCEKKMESQPELSEQAKKIKQLSEQFAKIEITADVSHLSQRERALLEKLIEAGKLCDAIFWKQSSHDAIAVRDSLIKLNTEEAKIFLEYVNINYGPYDVLNENVRFVGVGPEKRPPGGGFYPKDITKEEFENHIKNNPKDKEAFESQYSVIVRENGGLKAIPYHQYYPETEKLAKLLEEAAELADNPTLKNYLILRAKATRTDDYYESDMAWMDIENSNIDVIIGPIENYSDALYNYKTAYEAVVMVKDIEASKELEMFQKHIPDFQNNLPYDKKYIEPVKTEKEILQIVNVVYFGGDCQKGTKTIAAALPNDPRVHETKGGKKSMFKNMMEAKFKTIVVPIANEIIAPELRGYVDSKAFTSFVTLHEVSHTLGRGYVYGSKDLTVRKALKERYSAIEETKADILSMFNHQTLLKLGKLDEEYIKKAIVTYIAGLYRSLRFGTNSAHGQANLIQLNYLREKGAIIRNQDGTFSYDEKKFFDGVASLANLILTTQAQGDYNKAGEIIEKYGKVNDEIRSTVERLKNIPRDINTTYKF